MAKNKLSDLRDHLFETIEMLKDPESGMTVEKAKAISGTAQTILNSAKLEIEFIELTASSDAVIGQQDFFKPKQLNA